MREIQADLWDVEADARVISTNGFISKRGTAVMGRGCALEAAVKYPELPRLLGKMLADSGNHVHLFQILKDEEGYENIVTYPVKTDWYRKADLELIMRSAGELVVLSNMSKWEKVVLPRVGCGNGRLSWEQDVKGLIEDVLDDRFWVCNYP